MEVLAERSWLGRLAGQHFPQAVLGHLSPCSGQPGGKRAHCGRDPARPHSLQVPRHFPQSPVSEEPVPNTSGNGSPGSPLLVPGMKPVAKLGLTKGVSGEGCGAGWGNTQLQRHPH